MTKKIPSESNTASNKNQNEAKHKFPEENVKFLNDTAVEMGMDGLHREAIACLKKGLRLDPENSRLWLNLGLSFYALNELENCIYALRQSLNTDANQPDAWDLLGLVFQEKGNFIESKLSYDQALKFEPENGRIWNNYGTLLFAEKKYKEARRAFESAIALNSNLGDAVFNLRDTYIELGENELADKCCEILKELEYEE